MNNKLLTLVLLSTYALSATKLTFNNNSNQELIIGSITATAMLQRTLGPQASLTFDKDVNRADSSIAVYLAASPHNKSTIRFTDPTFDKNKTTYNISIVANKIVVS
jgi:hypothetical protein